MSHDPSICDCSKCKECKSRFADNFETRYCKKDGKLIEFWGKDICPKATECIICGIDVLKNDIEIIDFVVNNDIDFCCSKHFGKELGDYIKKLSGKE